ncbi:MAG: serine/threonine protein kinase, partial [Myxococcales bacterium]|nr:serine/threonine protein kinase [Myxococcales bacterium]
MLESAELAAGTQVDQYSVVRLLGRGGMGEVYLARDASLGRRVALKLIARDCLADTQLRERFLYEARTTARFSHPNIVNIHSIGEYDGRPYMALEYLEGESLRDRLARGALPQREALAIGACIADALAEAHRHGILHRDLKPANVMLAADGRPRVLDFGLAMGLPDGAAGEASARAMSVTKPPPFEHTSTGLRGTPHFMAPEQWAEAEASAATDVWALGVCLVQMFSGELPYGDVGSLLSLAARVSSAAEVPRVAALGARLPAPAGRLLARCLDKRAEGRPQAAEVASGLRAALGTSTPSVAITHPAAPARPPAAESAIGEMPTLAQPAVAQARAEQAQQTPAAPRRRSSLALWIVLAFVAVAAAGVGVGLAVRGSGAKRDAEPALAQKPPAASPKDAKNPSAADAAPSALALAAKQIQVQTAPSRVEQRQGPAPSPSPDSDQPPQRQARTTPEPAA